MMFDLENKPSGPFEFGLEQEIRDDPGYAKELMQRIEERIGELKNLLRQGAETDDFDEYGVLLHSYVALQKTLKKVVEKK